MRGDWNGQNRDKSLARRNCAVAKCFGMVVVARDEYKFYAAPDKVQTLNKMDNWLQKAYEMCARVVEKCHRETGDSTKFRRIIHLVLHAVALAANAATFRRRDCHRAIVDVYTRRRRVSCCL